MAEIEKDLEDLILAGLGVAAYSSERGRQFIDELVSQSKDALSWNRMGNTELRHDPEAEARIIRESELEASMRAMTPEERRAFAAAAAKFAQQQNAASIDGGEDAHAGPSSDAHPVEDGLEPVAIDGDDGVSVASASAGRANPDANICEPSSASGRTDDATCQEL